MSRQHDRALVQATANRYDAEISRLRRENEELRRIIHDAVGPTVAWASEWQNRNSTTDLHPQHQELIDRMTAATQSTSK